MQEGEIWIIESDIDDQHAIQLIWKKLSFTNRLVFFNDAASFLFALSKASQAPFIIICDVRLDGIDGFALRRDMLAQHSKKYSSVPFIFWSSASREVDITEAYDLSVHGFFLKETEIEDLKNTLNTIISYWQISKMPAKA